LTELLGYVNFESGILTSRNKEVFKWESMALKEIDSGSQAGNGQSQETNCKENPSDILARVRKEKGDPPIHNSVPGLRRMGEREIPLTSEEIEPNSVVPNNST
jgi:hypothetical protein